MAAEDFIITKKRKLYKFAKFAEFGNCFEAEQWHGSMAETTFQAADRKVLELGAGTGHFLLELALRRPDSFFVAVDVKADRLYSGARLALERGVRNIVFVRAHAEQLSELFGDSSLNEIWLTFSDPFPKKRQAKHRMTHRRFLQVYAAILKPYGILHFKTDNHPLFDWSLEQFAAFGGRLKNLTYDLHASELDETYKIMTTYEARFVSEGMPIYSVDVVFDAPSR